MSDREVNEIAERIAAEQHERLHPGQGASCPDPYHYCKTFDTIRAVAKAIITQFDQREVSFRQRIEELERPGVIPKFEARIAELEAMVLSRESGSHQLAIELAQHRQQVTEYENALDEIRWFLKDEPGGEDKGLAIFLAVELIDKVLPRKEKDRG